MERLNKFIIEESLAKLSYYASCSIDEEYDEKKIKIILKILEDKK